MSILKTFKDILFESLKEHKKLILGLYLFLIICFIASWVLSADAVNANLANIQNISSLTPKMDTSVSALDLFMNNEKAGIIIYVSSVFFAISAIVALAYNGINMGMVGQLFNQLIPNGGARYIVYLIPHGIFEITATVLESTAGILLFLFIWRFIKAWRSSETNGASDAFDKTKKTLIQSIVIMIFCAILLLIAAPIEAYVSVPFSEWIVGA